MRISDWSSDVCSSDLMPARLDRLPRRRLTRRAGAALLGGGGGEAEILERDAETSRPRTRPVLDERQRGKGAARVAISVEKRLVAARPAGELLAHVARRGGLADHPRFRSAERRGGERRASPCETRG